MYMLCASYHLCAVTRKSSVMATEQMNWLLTAKVQCIGLQ